MKEPYNYHYCETFKCLVQTDSSGNIVQSMSMPVDDLGKISFLSWVMNNERDHVADMITNKEQNYFENLVKTEDSVL